MCRTRLAASAALVLVTVLAAGCMTSSDALSGHAWKLVEIAGAAPVADAGLEFGTDGLLKVRPGCNAGSGGYRIDGNRLRMDQLALTAMACTGPASAQEAAFLAALNGSPAFEIETGTARLRLKGAAGDLVFVAP